MNMHGFAEQNGSSTSSNAGSSSGAQPLRERIEEFSYVLSRKVDNFLDPYKRFPGPRWAILVGFLLLYAIRVWYAEGWYIVTYGLAIYLLNLFIGFLTPIDDPDLNPGLPSSTKDASEAKPFSARRRVPEFKFWYLAMRGTFIAFLMTFFRIFDVAVFWPILVVYFFALFYITMRKQIRHMIKHKYIPFDFGKPKHYVPK
eukprot:g3343.t1